VVVFGRGGWYPFYSLVGLIASNPSGYNRRGYSSLEGVRIMKKMPISNNNETENDDMLPEYDFDYRKAKPNRFALKENQQVVILDPYVAEYFKDSESVNRVLRAIITNMPQTVL
jgi:hypothetical protein